MWSIVKPEPCPCNVYTHKLIYINLKSLAAYKNFCFIRLYWMHINTLDCQNVWWLCRKTKIKEMCQSATMLIYSESIKSNIFWSHDQVLTNYDFSVYFSLAVSINIESWGNQGYLQTEIHCLWSCELTNQSFKTRVNSLSVMLT